MGYFSKEIYDRKNEWAGKRMIENSENPNLTPEQHEALSEICRIRHQLHVNSDSAFNTESSEYDSFDFYPSEWQDELSEIERLIAENNLPKIKILKRTFENWLNDRDWNDDEIEYKGVLYPESIDEDDDDDEFFHNKNEAAREITNNTLQLLDQHVRNYLKYIDHLFGTDYAPSGGEIDEYL